MNNAISISNLQFCYSDKRNQSEINQQKWILDIPSWQCEAGKSVFLHGPSGSGKSTLLNLLSGTLSLSIQKTNKGEISVLNTPMHSISAAKKDKFRAQNLGVVFQQFNLINYLSVADNIRLAHSFSKSRSEFNEEKLKQALTNLNLPISILRQKAKHLSVGQQQRVAIARALFHQPKLLIVDEPTSALDSQSTAKFMELLLNNAQALGMSLLFVSHDMRLASDFDTCTNLLDINSVSLNVDSCGELV